MACVIMHPEMNVRFLEKLFHHEAMKRYQMHRSRVDMRDVPGTQDTVRALYFRLMVI